LDRFFDPRDSFDEEELRELWETARRR
jgi:hypothetical protein